MADHGTVILLPDSVSTVSGYALTSPPVDYGAVIFLEEPSNPASNTGQIWPSGATTG
jgi:hypothetical protein